MRINRFFLLAGFLAFLFSACGEENPAVFPIETSSNDISSSSSFSTQYSSSPSTFSNSIETSSSSWEPYSYGELTDERDGQTYKTIKIGEQLWMAENLNYAYPKQDSSLDSVSWCYNNEPDNCAKYGRLYTWEAAMDCYTQFGENKSACSLFYHDKERNNDYKPQGACPTNWHIPYGNEWTALIDLVRDSSSALKSTSGWLDDGNGTDIFGFSVLPAGMFDAGDLNRQKKYTFKSGYGVGKITCFWTTTQSTMDLGDISPISDYESAIALCFSNDNPYVLLDDVVQSKFHAFSVRCVKDAEASK